jgi:hypothetical protein
MAGHSGLGGMSLAQRQWQSGGGEARRNDVFVAAAAALRIDIGR